MHGNNIKKIDKYFSARIGFSIAERLAQEGAKVVVSSRKQNNVDAAVEKLKNYDVLGVKCHVANAQDRKNLYDAVSFDDSTVK